MKIPKRGIKIQGKIITWNGMWYGRTIRYGKERYFKSCSCRFDDTCGGTKEISGDEFLAVAQRYSKIFGE